MFIRKAERRKSKLRLALCGVSGSGKTMSAIKIAKGIGGKFVFIDTENGSADLYCHIADYDVLTLAPPFTTDKYIKAIKMCEDADYETIIIDSLSHAWSGSGGILEQQSIATSASKSKNSYTAWSEVTPKHNNLISTIIQSKCHVISCMLSKTQYETQMGPTGKMTPVKIGLAPIQRADIEREFTVALDIDSESHFFRVMKDRTELFEGRNEIITESIGAELIEWLNNGVSRDEIVNKHIDSIDKSKTLADLKDSFIAAYSDNLLDDEIEKITQAKDKKKEEIEEIEFADDTVNL